MGGAEGHFQRGPERAMPDPGPAAAGIDSAADEAPTVARQGLVAAKGERAAPAIAQAQAGSAVGLDSQNEARTGRFVPGAGDRLPVGTGRGRPHDRRDGECRQVCREQRVVRHGEGADRRVLGLPGQPARDAGCRDLLLEPRAAGQAVAADQSHDVDVVGRARLAMHHEFHRFARSAGERGAIADQRLGRGLVAQSIRPRSPVNSSEQKEPPWNRRSPSGSAALLPSSSAAYSSASSTGR